MGVITQTFSESKSITYLKAFCKVPNEQMPSLGIGETESPCFRLSAGEGASLV